MHCSSSSIEVTELDLLNLQSVRSLTYGELKEWLVQDIE